MSYYQLLVKHQNLQRMIRKIILNLKYKAINDHNIVLFLIVRKIKKKFKHRFNFRC
jgi:hypothetical protein